MIQPNELKIGNFLLYQDKEVRVYGIKGDTVWLDSYGAGWAAARTLYPIALTEEWLLKFGFEDGDLKVGDQQLSIRLKQKEFLLFGYDACTNGMAFGGEIEYVHQLQNLFFALTGKELELKKELSNS